MNKYTKKLLMKSLQETYKIKSYEADLNAALKPGSIQIAGIQARQI